MRLVPTHPSAIASFIYDETSRTLSAHYANGRTTVCRDVPEAMFHVLEKTPAPGDFFRSYAATICRATYRRKPEYTSFCTPVISAGFHSFFARSMSRICCDRYCGAYDPLTRYS